MTAVASFHRRQFNLTTTASSWRARQSWNLERAFVDRFIVMNESLHALTGRGLDRGGLSVVSLLGVKHTIIPEARAKLAAALPSTTEILRGSLLIAASAIAPAVPSVPADPATWSGS